MGKSAPAVPDYRGAAEETAQASGEAANQQNYANRPDQTNPWGSTTYGTEAYTDPATGQEVTKWSQNQTLDPKIQGALDSQLALTQDRSDLGGALMPRVAEDYAQGMDFSKYGDPNMGYSAEQIDMSYLPQGVGSLTAGQYTSPELQQNLDYSGASEIGQTPQAGEYNSLDLQQNLDYSGASEVGQAPQAGQYTGPDLRQNLDYSGAYEVGQAPQAGQYTGPELQKSLDYSGASEVGQAGNYRNQAEDAMYNRRTSRLDPQFEGRQEALEVKLNNQGLRPGDQAYDSAMQSLGMERTDAYSAAQNEAIMSGGAEASRMFGMDMSRRGQDISEANTAADFYNQSRAQQSAIDLDSGDQQFNEGAKRFDMDMSRRGQDINEANNTADFYNQSRAQQSAIDLASGNQQFNEGAQRFGMDMSQRGQDINEANTAANFYNQSRGQQSAMDLASGGQQFAEGAQRFGMDMSRRGQDISETDSAANFYNQSRGQQSAIDLASGGQRFNEAQGAGDFQNAARQRALAEQMTIKDRSYNQGNQDADRQNAIRTGMMNEEMAQRGANLNEVNALISGQQVNAPQMAGFQNAGRAQSADYSGAMGNAYDARLNQTNASNAGVQGMMNMGGTVAGMFSDRRLKKHIKRVGQLLGYPLYRFQYLWGDWAVGVMSDEINQDAVFKHASGYDMVNYKGIK